MNRRINAAVTGAVLGVAGVAQASAQFVASAGNGGVATASANGGAVSAGDINSGGNVCNAIGIGNTSAFVPVDPQVNGGDCLNSTALGITVDGGTGIADASGGDYNLAFVS
jgi:hypothetical protein